MKKILLNTIQTHSKIDTDKPLFLWRFPGNEESLSKFAHTLPTFNLSHQEAANLNHNLNIWIDQDIIPWITHHLNTKHQTTYSPEFWALLLKPWLGYIVSTTYTYFLLLQSVVTDSQEPLQFSPITPKTPWEFKDTFDFIYRGYQDPLLHGWLVSELLCNTFQDKLTKLPKHIITPEKPSYKKGIESVSDTRFRRCLRVKGLSTFSEIALSYLLNFKKSKKKSDPQSLMTNQPIIGIETSLFPIMQNLLEQTIPLSFTTYFTHYNAKALKKKYTAQKIRIVGPVMVYHEQLKFYLAHAKENGEILISTQHGGNYGWHLAHREPMLFEYRFDYFISWGWTKAGDLKNILPLPSPYLKKFLNKHRFKSKEIILVGTDINPMNSYCIPYPFLDTKFLSYRNEKLSFLRTLPTQLQPHITYRAYPLTNRRLADFDYLKKSLHWLQPSIKDLHQSLLNCELCCLDHLGTTLLICLAANIPVICFWQPEHCDLNDEATVLLQEMESENLYFPSGKAAAEFITSISDHIPDWWQTKQPLRKKLMAHHANTQKWLLPWVKTIVSL